MKPEAIVLQNQGVSTEVFASREGIVTFEKVDDCVDMYAVKVSPTPKFNDGKDYVVIVINKGGRFEVRTVAGKAPRWASFPEQWATWVQNADVRCSSCEYITARVPACADSLTVASRKTGKQKCIDAWSKVAEECGLDVAKVRGNGTWTAVHAMPVRIAQALSGKSSRPERWEPTVPRPIYQEAAKSGRVLVCGPKGE
jgi:hypothetical protein